MFCHRAGYTATFSHGSCTIRDRTKKVIGRVPFKNGLYRVDWESTEAPHVTKDTLTVMELHARMGHIAPETAKHLVTDGLVTGIELDTTSSVESCDSCAYGKLIRQRVPRERQGDRAKELGGEIHTDVWGPSPMKTLGGKAYYVSFTDDYSRHTRIHLLVHKSDAYQAYLTYEAWLNTQHKANIKVLRSDRGGEYLSGEFSKHLQEKGTIRHLTVHDTPQQNGIAERLNRTLLEHTRAMLHAAKLPNVLWGEAVMHAVWLKNRTSTKALDGKTPHEMLTGVKPDLADLREWGSKIWIHTPDGSKLDGRAKEGRWMGFDLESKGSRVYFLDTKRVSVECNIQFDDGYVLVPGSMPSKGESADTDVGRPAPSETSEAVPAEDPPSTELTPLDPLEDLPAAEPERARRIGKPSAYIQRIEAGEGTATGRRGANILPRGIPLREPEHTAMAASDMDEFIPDFSEEAFAMATIATIGTGIEPKHITEARASKDWPMWEEAMNEQLTRLKHDNTWTLVPVRVPVFLYAILTRSHVVFLDGIT